VSKSNNEDDLNRRIAAAGLGGNALPEGTTLSKLIKEASSIDGVHNLKHSKQEKAPTKTPDSPKFI
jgi:hypothetical protein